MKLVHVLIAKSIVEALLVGTLAVLAFAQAFPPHFYGWGEVTPSGIAGWAVNYAAPWDRVEVQVFVDQKFVANGVANLSRPDVLAAGWSKDEWHGYAFSIGSLQTGTHEARVYAMHQSGGGTRRTLQLLGDPIHFSVDEQGRLRSLRGLAQ